jgi:hypothetical protein
LKETRLEYARESARTTRTIPISKVATKEWDSNLVSRAHDRSVPTYLRLRHLFTRWLI